MKFKNDARKFWVILNSVLINAKRNNFKINICYVPEHDITDHFNNYFSSVGRNISDSIPPNNVSPNFYLRGSFPNTCFLSPCSSDEIYNILMSHKKKKVNSLHIVPVRILKSDANIISIPLSLAKQ